MNAVELILLDINPNLTTSLSININPLRINSIAKNTRIYLKV